MTVLGLLGYTVYQRWPIFALIGDIWNTKQLITLELNTILMKFVVYDHHTIGREWWWKSGCGSIFKPATPTQRTQASPDFKHYAKKLGRAHDSQILSFVIILIYYFQNIFFKFSPLTDLEKNPGAFPSSPIRFPWLQKLGFLH